MHVIRTAGMSAKTRVACTRAMWRASRSSPSTRRRFASGASEAAETAEDMVRMGNRLRLAERDARRASMQDGNAACAHTTLSAADPASQSRRDQQPRGDPQTPNSLPPCTVLVSHAASRQCSVGQLNHGPTRSPRRDMGSFHAGGRRVLGLVACAGVCVCWLGAAARAFHHGSHSCVCQRIGMRYSYSRRWLAWHPYFTYRIPGHFETSYRKLAAHAPGAGPLNMAAAAATAAPMRQYTVSTARQRCSCCQGVRLSRTRTVIKIVSQPSRPFAPCCSPCSVGGHVGQLRLHHTTGTHDRASTVVFLRHVCVAAALAITLVAHVCVQARRHRKRRACCGRGAWPPALLGSFKRLMPVGVRQVDVEGRRRARPLEKGDPARCVPQWPPRSLACALTRHPPRIAHSMPQRFFVLLPGELRYYPSESSTSPKGAITLKGARGFCCTHHALKVLILTPDRVWVLECQSKLQIQELGAAMKATAPVIQGARSAAWRRAAGPRRPLTPPDAEMQADWMAKLPASKVSRAVIDKWKRYGYAYCTRILAAHAARG